MEEEAVWDTFFKFLFQIVWCNSDLITGLLKRNKKMTCTSFNILHYNSTVNNKIKITSRMISFKFK